jgi:hypothetical protein
VAKLSDVDFAAHAGRVARALFGEPNRIRSAKTTLRFGTNGSMAVDLVKGVFFSHEQCQGGGVLWAIKYVKGLEGRDAINWMREIGCDIPMNGRDLQAGPSPKKIVVDQHRYPDANGTLVFVTERIEYQSPDGSFVTDAKTGKPKKTFRQKRPDPDQPGSWIYNTEGVPPLIYRLPEVAEAIATDFLIVVVEGERKVDLLWSLGVPATTNAGGANKWKAEHSQFLRGADVIIIPDNDEAGYKHVQTVGKSLIGIVQRVRVCMLPGLVDKGDIVDWANKGGTREQLDKLIEQAPDFVPASKPAPSEDAAKAEAAATEQELIDELAQLNRRAYDQRRNQAAAGLGIRRGTLDREVEARRAEHRAQAGPAPLFGHWLVEPWPEEVDTGAFLLALVRRLQGHVVLSNEAAIAIALWILLAWVHDVAAVHFPNLLVTSAEANSGKTTLASLISYMTPRALLTVGISEAALFRSIEIWHPTVVVTEADTLLVDNEPLRAVINSGWTRGAGVLRCIGDEKLPTFSRRIAQRFWI